MSLQHYANNLESNINKLPHKQISMFIITLLLVYIAYLSAKITWLAVPTSSFATNQTKRVDAKSPTNYNVDINAIQKLNLFGHYDEQPVAKVDEVISEEAPETSLNLTLKGVVASTDINTAAAIVENSGKQETYGIGDNIKGTRAVLERVYNDRILIKISGRLETLMIEGIDYNQQITPVVSTKNKVKKEPVKSKRKSMNALSMKAQQAKRVDQRKNKQLVKKARDLKKTLLNNNGKLTDYLKISPKRVGGKIVGYRLMPGKDINFFKEAGLKSGDLAIGMNGYDLTQIAEAAQAMQSLRTEKEVSLLLDRNGDITEILFSIE